MSASLQRKNRPKHNRLTSNFKVLEEGLLEQPLHNIVCHNCKSRHELVELKTDNKNLRCGHCGALTPIRSLRHTRGLAAPQIQQADLTAIAQPENVPMGRNRIPRGIHSNKQKNPFEEQLLNKGFQIIDTQYVEPVPQE
jgi:hypothetical protein